LHINPDNETIDRQDEWQYQNSITGEWFYWRSIYKKQNSSIEWRVKWLNVAPTSSLGVIVYLTTRNELDSLNKSLLQLSRLLVNNPRPVVIFHEGDFSDNDTQLSLAQTLGSRTPLGFERIRVFNSTKGPWSVYRRSPWKYYDMCRFFTLMLPNHPLLTLFSFYWRLDSHSYIFALKPIADPFEIMQKRNIQYAFTMINEEAPVFVIGLWSFFHQFLSDSGLKPSRAFHQTQTDSSGGYSHAIIFNNFAIANVSLFRDHSLIRFWLHKVDRNGGIYRHRWGDAPIHTLALTQFLQREQIAQLRYFGYWHQREYACADGMKINVCKDQVRSFPTGLQKSYHYYHDGCWPSTRNPLCYYYPQIKL
jgi:hypothetical protein